MVAVFLNYAVGIWDGSFRCSTCAAPCFMLVATICSLCITISKKFGMIGGGTAAWGDWFQLVFALAMVILAVILVIEAIGTFQRQAAKGRR